MPYILLVDDEPLVLRALKRQLERLGAQVVVTTDPNIASLMIAKRTYDVVISDYDLKVPGRDGLWLLDSVPAGTKRILTSGTSLGDIPFTENVDAFLPKPTDFNELALIIGLEKEVYSG
jgi:CheY-like chemotaxis protein